MVLLVVSAIPEYSLVSSKYSPFFFNCSLFFVFVRWYFLQIYLISYFLWFMPCFFKLLSLVCCFPICPLLETYFWTETQALSTPSLTFQIMITFTSFICFNLCIIFVFVVSKLFSTLHFVILMFWHSGFPLLIFVNLIQKCYLFFCLMS